MSDLEQDANVFQRIGHALGAPVEDQTSEGTGSVGYDLERLNTLQVSLERAEDLRKKGNAKLQEIRRAQKLGYRMVDGKKVYVRQHFNDDGTQQLANFTDLARSFSHNLKAQGKLGGAELWRHIALADRNLTGREDARALKEDLNEGAWYEKAGLTGATAVNEYMNAKTFGAGNYVGEIMGEVLDATGISDIAGVDKKFRGAAGVRKAREQALNDVQQLSGSIAGIEFSIGGKVNELAGLLGFMKGAGKLGTGSTTRLATLAASGGGKGLSKAGLAFITGMTPKGAVRAMEGTVATGLKGFGAKALQSAANFGAYEGLTGMVQAAGEAGHHLSQTGDVDKAVEIWQQKMGGGVQIDATTGQVMKDEFGQPLREGGVGGRWLGGVMTGAFMPVLQGVAGKVEKSFLGAFEKLGAIPKRVVGSTIRNLFGTQPKQAAGRVVGAATGAKMVGGAIEFMGFGFLPHLDPQNQLHFQTFADLLSDDGNKRIAAHKALISHAINGALIKGMQRRQGAGIGMGGEKQPTMYDWMQHYLGKEGKQPLALPASTEGPGELLNAKLRLMEREGRELPGVTDSVVLETVKIMADAIEQFHKTNPEAGEKAVLELAKMLETEAAIASRLMKGLAQGHGTKDKISEILPDAAIAEFRKRLIERADIELLQKAQKHHIDLARDKLIDARAEALLPNVDPVADKYAQEISMRQEILKGMEGRLSELDVRQLQAEMDQFNKLLSERQQHLFDTGEDPMAKHEAARKEFVEAAKERVLELAGEQTKRRRDASTAVRQDKARKALGLDVDAELEAQDLFPSGPKAKGKKGETQGRNPRTVTKPPETEKQKAARERKERKAAGAAKAQAAADRIASREKGAAPDARDVVDFFRAKAEEFEGNAAAEQSYLVAADKLEQIGEGRAKTILTEKGVAALAREFGISKKRAAEIRDFLGVEKFKPAPPAAKGGAGQAGAKDKGPARLTDAEARELKEASLNLKVEGNPRLEALEATRAARQAWVEGLGPHEAKGLDHKEQQQWLGQRKARQAGTKVDMDAMDAAAEVMRLMIETDNRIGMDRVESDLADKLRDIDGMRERGADADAIKRAEAQNKLIRETLSDLAAMREQGPTGGKTKEAAAAKTGADVLVEEYKKLGLKLSPEDAPRRLRGFEGLTDDQIYTKLVKQGATKLTLDKQFAAVKKALGVKLRPGAELPSVGEEAGEVLERPTHEITEYPVLKDGFSIGMVDGGPTGSRITLGTSGPGLEGMAPPGYVFVHEVRVDPSRQRQGHGIDLYRRAIEEAKARGFKGVVDGGAQGSGAKAIWEKLVKSGEARKTERGYESVSDKPGERPLTDKDYEPVEGVELVDKAPGETGYIQVPVTNLREGLDTQVRQIADALRKDENNFRLGKRIVELLDQGVPASRAIQLALADRPTALGIQINSPDKKRWLKVPRDVEVEAPPIPAGAERVEIADIAERYTPAREKEVVETLSPEEAANIGPGSELPVTRFTDIDPNRPFDKFDPARAREQEAQPGGYMYHNSDSDYRVVTENPLVAETKARAFKGLGYELPKELDDLGLSHEKGSPAEAKWLAWLDGAGKQYGDIARGEGRGTIEKAHDKLLADLAAKAGHDFIVIRAEDRSGVTEIISMKPLTEVGFFKPGVPEPVKGQDTVVPPTNTAPPPKRRISVEEADKAHAAAEAMIRKLDPLDAPAGTADKLRKIANAIRNAAQNSDGAERARLNRKVRELESNADFFDKVESRKEQSEEVDEQGDRPDKDADGKDLDSVNKTGKPEVRDGPERSLDEFRERSDEELLDSLDAAAELIPSVAANRAMIEFGIRQGKEYEQNVGERKNVSFNAAFGDKVVIRTEDGGAIGGIIITDPQMLADGGRRVVLWDGVKQHRVRLTDIVDWAPESTREINLTVGKDGAQIRDGAEVSNSTFARMLTPRNQALPKEHVHDPKLRDQRTEMLKGNLGTEADQRKQAETRGRRFRLSKQADRDRIHPDDHRMKAESMLVDPKDRRRVFTTQGGDATAGYVDPFIARMARLVTLRNKRERGEKLESDEAAFLMTETSGERDALAFDAEIYYDPKTARRRTLAELEKEAQTDPKAEQDLARYMTYMHDASVADARNKALLSDKAKRDGSSYLVSLAETPLIAEGGGQGDRTTHRQIAVVERRAWNAARGIEIPAPGKAPFVIAELTESGTWRLRDRSSREALEVVREHFDRAAKSMRKWASDRRAIQRDVASGKDILDAGDRMEVATVRLHDALDIMRRMAEGEKAPVQAREVFEQETGDIEGSVNTAAIHARTVGEKLIAVFPKDLADPLLRWLENNPRPAESDRGELAEWLARFDNMLDGGEGTIGFTMRMNANAGLDPITGRRMVRDHQGNWRVEGMSSPRKMRSGGETGSVDFSAAIEAFEKARKGMGKMLVKLYNGRTAEVLSEGIMDGGEKWVRARFFRYDREKNEIVWEETHNIAEYDIAQDVPAFKEGATQRYGAELAAPPAEKPATWALKITSKNGKVSYRAGIKSEKDADHQKAVALNDPNRGHIDNIDVVRVHYRDGKAVEGEAPGYGAGGIPLQGGLFPFGGVYDHLRGERGALDKDARTAVDKVRAGARFMRERIGGYPGMAYGFVQGLTADTTAAGVQVAIVNPAAKISRKIASLIMRGGNGEVGIGWSPEANYTAARHNEHLARLDKISNQSDKFVRKLRKKYSREEILELVRAEHEGKKPEALDEFRELMRLAAKAAKSLGLAGKDFNEKYDGRYVRFGRWKWKNPTQMEGLVEKAKLLAEEAQSRMVLLKQALDAKGDRATEAEELQVAQAQRDLVNAKAAQTKLERQLKRSEKSFLNFFRPEQTHAHPMELVDSRSIRDWENSARKRTVEDWDKLLEKGLDVDAPELLLWDSIVHQFSAIEKARWLKQVAEDPRLSMDIKDAPADWTRIDREEAGSNFAFRNLAGRAVSPWTYHFMKLQEGPNGILEKIMNDLHSGVKMAATMLAPANYMLQVIANPMQVATKSGSSLFRAYPEYGKALIQLMIPSQRAKLIKKYGPLKYMDVATDYDREYMHNMKKANPSLNHENIIQVVMETISQFGQGNLREGVQGAARALGLPFNRALQFVSWVYRQLDTAGRISTYRLLKKAGKTHAEANEAVVQGWDLFHQNKFGDFLRKGVATVGGNKIPLPFMANSFASVGMTFMRNFAEIAGKTPLQMAELAVYVMLNDSIVQTQYGLTDEEVQRMKENMYPNENDVIRAVRVATTPLNWNGRQGIDTWGYHPIGAALDVFPGLEAAAWGAADGFVKGGVKGAFEGLFEGRDAYGVTAGEDIVSRALGSQHMLLAPHIEFALDRDDKGREVRWKYETPGVAGLGGKGWAGWVRMSVENGQLPLAGMMLFGKLGGFSSMAATEMGAAASQLVQTYDAWDKSEHGEHTLFEMISDGEDIFDVRPRSWEDSLARKFGFKVRNPNALQRAIEGARRKKGIEVGPRGGLSVERDITDPGTVAQLKKLASLGNAAQRAKSGAYLWGMMRHYANTKNPNVKAAIERRWPSAQSRLQAARALVILDMAKEASETLKLLGMFDMLPPPTTVPKPTPAAVQGFVRGK